MRTIFERDKSYDVVRKENGTVFSWHYSECIEEYETRSCMLSLIITAYNQGKYIKTCLQSIADNHNCTIDDFEIIVVNDGSTDNTHDVINDFLSESNQRITYIRQENQGPGSARNIGIKYARGNYIWIIDGDDMIANNSIENILYACASGADIIRIGLIFWKSESENYYAPINRDSWVLENPLSYLTFKKEYFAPHQNLIFKHDLIMKDSILYPIWIKQNEDYLFIVRLLMSANTIYANGTFQAYMFRMNVPVSLSRGPYDFERLNCDIQDKFAVLHELTEMLSCGEYEENRLHALETYIAEYILQIIKTPIARRKSATLALYTRYRLDKVYSSFIRKKLLFRMICNPFVYLCLYIVYPVIYPFYLMVKGKVR